jgi:hypothetical protein
VSWYPLVPSVSLPSAPPPPPHRSPFPPCEQLLAAVVGGAAVVVVALLVALLVVVVPSRFSPFPTCEQSLVVAVGGAVMVVIRRRRRSRPFIPRIPVSCSSLSPRYPCRCPLTHPASRVRRSSHSSLSARCPAIACLLTLRAGLVAVVVDGGSWVVVM